MLISFITCLLIYTDTRPCRPHYVVFPHDEAGFAIDDQFFVGSSGLLVKPVTAKGVTEATVYLPEDEVSVSR